MRGFHKQHAWLVRNFLHGKAGLMKAAAAGGLWPAARLRAADDRYDGLSQRCLAEGNEAEETMLHRVWQCPCNPTSGVFGATEKWCKKAEEQKDEFACFWMRGLVPKTWTEANLWPEFAPGIVGCMTWQPDIYFSDGSGGVHSKDPRLRRVGWGIVRLDQDGELREACHGSVPGKQTVPRAELMALIDDFGGEHRGSWQLRAQGGRAVPPHFHGKAQPEQNVVVTETCGRDSSGRANRSISASSE